MTTRPAFAPAGASSLSIAGSANRTLTKAESRVGLLTLTGARTADAVVTLANLPGHRLAVRNGTTGAFLAQLAGPGGGGAYLGPGQTKVVYVDSSGVLQSDEIPLFCCEITRSFIRGAGGTYDTTILRLPPRLLLYPVTFRCDIGVAGGPTRFGLGITGGGIELLKDAEVPSTAGLIYGNLAAHLGAAYTEGTAPFDTAQDVHLGELASAAVSAGQGTFHFLGQVLT